jgi:probable rRNA maturation factor
MTEFLDLIVSAEDPAWETALPDAEGLASKAALAAFAAVPHPDRPCEAGLLLTHDAAMREMNRNFRGQDKPTNVLSFPAWDGDDPAAGLPAGAPVLLGDIAIALGVLEREAESEGKPLAHHFSHLVVHGMLHLMGHDHERGDAEAAVMEDLERRILAGLGIPDPYAEGRE